MTEKKNLKNVAKMLKYGWKLSSHQCQSLTEKGQNVSKQHSIWNQLSKKKIMFWGGMGLIYFCNDLAKQTIYNGYLFHLKMFSVFVKMKFVFFRSYLAYSTYFASCFVYSPLFFCSVNPPQLHNSWVLNSSKTKLEYWVRVKCECTF